MRTTRPPGMLFSVIDPSAGATAGEQDEWRRPQQPGVNIELRRSVATSGSRVLHVRGEIDELDAHAVREAAQEHLGSAPGLVVDLDGVTFLGTFGLNVLVRLAGVASRRGARFAVAATPRNTSVRRPIFIAGLAELLHLTEHAA